MTNPVIQKRKRKRLPETTPFRFLFFAGAFSATASSSFSISTELRAFTESSFSFFFHAKKNSVCVSEKGHRSTNWKMVDSWYLKLGNVVGEPVFIEANAGEQKRRAVSVSHSLRATFNFSFIRDFDPPSAAAAAGDYIYVRAVTYPHFAYSLTLGCLSFY